LGALSAPLGSAARAATGTAITERIANASEIRLIMGKPVVMVCGIEGRSGSAARLRLATEEAVPVSTQNGG
jgi:hypothetical protein